VVCKDPNIQGLHLWEQKLFMQVAKKGDAFLIYVCMAQDPKIKQHEIMFQYKHYKNVFEKKCLQII
jgi:hypothetical protein